MIPRSELREPPANEPASPPAIDKLLADADRYNGGPRDWRFWKQQGVEELLELVRRAPRVEVLGLDMSGDLQVAYRIQMPIPRCPVGGQLVVGTAALYHLVYRDEWRTIAPKGWEPVGIVTPVDIFHPNAKPSLRGALCLGRLSAGITPKELVLLSYLAGSLQNVQLAEDDPEGVLNAAACEFFRCNPGHLPLTRTGLCEDWEPDGGN